MKRSQSVETQIISGAAHADESTAHHGLDPEGLVGLFLIGASGLPKFMDFPGKAEMMSKLQIPMSLLLILGVLEIAVPALYLTPRTLFLGAILTTAYHDGAVWTHL